MARYSLNGKLIGRPPGSGKKSAATNVPAPAPADQAKLLDRVMRVLARYDAAGRGRRMASWNAPPTGPNASLLGLQTIRNRARDAVRNDWAGESTIQKWATALIGIGITPRFNQLSGATKKAITQLWADFAAEADADGVLDVYGLQTLVVRTWFDGGECFVRRRARFPDAGFPVPVQIQVLEPEMCPLLDAASYQGLPAGNVIRSGIELNNKGGRVAYWFYKQHPGDIQVLSTINPGDLVRVAASDVCHVFEPKRPGQLRGVSALAPILAKLRSIGDFEDAVLERQKIANLFVAFITKALPSIDPNDPMTSAFGTQLEQMLDDVQGTQDPLMPMAPGQLQELDDGQTVSFANPPEAGTEYRDYMRTSHLGSAAASGLPYELYSGDIANISDRTLRVLINEFRRLAEQRQWQIVIPQFCQPVVGWFVDAAVLAGLLAVGAAADAKRVQHSPHGWPYIHPVQDVQGRALAVLNGFESRAQVVGERGDDVEQVDDERAEDMQREIRLGLATDPTKMPLANRGENGQQDGSTSRQSDQQNAATIRQIALGMQELREMQAAGASAAAVESIRVSLSHLLASIESNE